MALKDTAARSETSCGDVQYPVWVVENCRRFGEIEVKNLRVSESAVLFVACCTTVGVWDSLCPANKGYGGARPCKSG